MSDNRSVQEQQWLASVLPSQQQLDDVLGNDPAAALLGLAKTRAPIETGFVGDPGDDPELKKEFAVAQAAAAALKQDSSATLSAEQTQALHAFVHLLARPALRVVDGDIPAIPQSWERLKTAHDSVIRRIRGVGRIDTSQREHVGTGWFVAENVLLTNRHVAGALCGLDPHCRPGVARQAADGGRHDERAVGQATRRSARCGIRRSRRAPRAPRSGRSRRSARSIRSSTWRCWRSPASRTARTSCCACTPRRRPRSRGTTCTSSATPA